MAGFFFVDFFFRVGFAPRTALRCVPGSVL